MEGEDGLRIGTEINVKVVGIGVAAKGNSLRGGTSSTTGAREAGGDERRHVRLLE